MADPAGGLPLQGPATAEWFLRSIAERGPDMLSRHHRWVHESGVRPGCMAIHEHEVLSTVIQFAVVHDRLEALNLSCLEMALRRSQLHEAAIAESPDNPSYE